MKLHRAHTLQEIAELIGGKLVGNPELTSEGINELHVVEEGDIAFVDHPKYYEATLQSKAGVILIDKEVECPAGKGLIVLDDPFSAFNRLTTYFLNEWESHQESEPAIDPSATVMLGAHIGRFVKIGKNSVIHPGVVIYDHTVIGDDVIVHANSVIGSDAFYYKRRPGKHDRMLSAGRVVLEDGVEIGSACTIDRGVTSDTVVGKGTKIDNQVHIGHDTKIGERCLMAAHVGIAGCVVIEDEVVMWGQVGCAANVTIGKGAVILAQSGISKSLPGGKTYFGSPADEARQRMKELATLSILAKKK